MPTLPEELLALIFEQLASPDTFEVSDMLDDLTSVQDFSGRTSLIQTHYERMATLRNVCLASKTMHRLAWPILYRDFCNRRGDDYDEMELLPDYEGPTRKFLRTICLTPHYGHALKNLQIRQWTPIEAMRGEQLFELLQSDATISALFQWRARGFYFYDEKRFVDALHRALSLGLEDSLVLLLLVMCPNIRELELAPHIDFDRSLLVELLGILHGESDTEKPLPALEPDFEQEESDYIIAQMFGRPWPDQKLQKPLVLQSLSKLTLWSPGLANVSTGCIAQILTLPSLLTLEAHGINYRGSPDLLFEALRFSGKRSKLQRLALEDCQASSDNLSAILTFCPKLEELIVAWDNRLETTSILAPDGRICLEYGGIAEVLATHCEHLAELTLDGSRGWENAGPLPKHPFILGDELHDLDHLVQLTIAPHAIYGSDFGAFGPSFGASVPKSVTKLTILSEQHDPDQDGIEPFLERQDADLLALLQDPAFDRLSKVKAPGRFESSIHLAEKHGWKHLPQLSGENQKLVCLVNPSRSGTEAGPSVTHTTQVTEP